MAIGRDRASLAYIEMTLIAASLLFEENSLFRHINSLFAFQNSLLR